MRLSTSTNLCAFCPDGSKNTFLFCIRTCAEGGYRVLDLNLCEAMNPTSRLAGENWQDYVEEVRLLAEELGVVFSQAHLPYYDIFGEQDAARRRRMELLIRRSVEICGILGIPWAVTHPGTASENRAENLTRNLEYYRPLMELAASRGVGIALENDFAGHDRYTYCADVGELAELIDAFAMPKTVGACYDLGHANLAGGTHAADIRVLGHRLRALHVNDNRGDGDRHLLPFLGTVDWKAAMEALKEVGYAGDLTYEIQEYGRNFPNELKHLAVAHSLDVGRVLLAYYEGKQI